MLYGEAVGHSYPMMFSRFYFLHEIDGIEPVALVFGDVSHEWKI